MCVNVEKIKKPFIYFYGKCISLKKFFKKTWLIFIIFVLLIIAGTLPYWYEFIIETHFNINFNNDKNTERSQFKWEIIKNIGYFIGIVLLIWQISISNRRAKAAEKTADATLLSGVEQRYHNACEHLGSNVLSVRVGAIYNLYHISQSTNTYDQTIFDMFCAYLQNKPKEEPTLGNIITKKEKQIIIDKLFKVEKDKRVLINLKEIDLKGADLNGINFSNADLSCKSGADLTSTNLDTCVFDNADLSNAKLPEKLDVINSMNGAIMNGVNFISGTNLNGLLFKDGSWKNAEVRYTNLSNSNLSGTNLENTCFTGTNFTNATGLTFEKLIQTKNLYGVTGLDERLKKKLKDKKPELFTKPTNKEEENNG